MNFLLSDEQEQLLDTVRAFAVDRGDAGIRRQAVDGETGHDAGFWTELMDLGAGGITLPTDHGGLGMEMIDLALLCEALGYAGAPGPFLSHALAGIAIALAGSDAQKAHWLPRLASGAATGTVALSEAQGRWKPDDWTAALADGVLSGRKTAVLYPELADVIVVGLAGGGLALVETTGAALDYEAADAVDRTRRHASLQLDGLAAETMPGATLDLAWRVIDAALILLSADAFGGACKALDMSVDYAKTREQFGQLIGSFQALKHQLATMALNTEPVRGLYWYAAYAYDHVPDERSRVASIAKAHASERFLQACRDATEAHGGIGYTWEYDLHIWLKRAMFDQAMFGTADEHRRRAADLAGW